MDGGAVAADGASRLVLLERTSTQASVRAPGGVLLIATYELGHQPVNLASPLGALRAAGFQPFAVDTSVDEVGDAAIRRARLVAISTPMHTALRLGSAIAERVRQVNPDAHVCFYGHYAELNASHLLSNAAVSVLSGEYEPELVSLAAALADGAEPTGVSELTTAGSRSGPALSRLAMPLIDRSGLPPLDRYARLEVNGEMRVAGYIEATRGCHHQCTHCPITPVYRGRFFALPRETVVADALTQIEAGARHVTFGDPDFFNGPTHGLRIMREVRAVASETTFDVTIKVEHLLQHRSRLRELAELGCVFVVSAVETLSDEVLRRLRKGHTRADVEEALRLLDEVGIAMRPSLLPFTPWSTREDYAELLQFVAEHDLIEHIDPVHLSIRLLVPPGSAILAEDPDGTVFGPLDAPSFQHRWDHPDSMMDELQRSIAVVVEVDASRNIPARQTFATIWRTAHDATDLLSADPPRPIEARPRPPRLTEDWFC